MGIFSRKDKVVDLTEEYKDTRKVKPAVENASVPASQSSENPSTGGFFNFFGNSNNSTSTAESSSSEVSSSDKSPDENETLDAREKRRRLAKRLKDMTDTIESLSSQIYLLQQRIELLEKKNAASKYSEQD